MNQGPKRQALVDSVKHVTPEMQRYLDNLKRWGQEELERPDFVWHILLQSFSTWGGARGHEGLIGNQDNYGRVTFAALSEVDASERPLVLERIFLTTKVRYAVMKAKLMARNYDLIATILQGWELDRLLYNYTDHFKSAIAASEDEQQANHADRFGWGEGPNSW